MSELWEHQKEGIEAYFKGKKLLAYGIGTGKTRMALAIQERIQSHYKYLETLVLSPLSAQHTWEKESLIAGVKTPDIMSYELFLNRSMPYDKYSLVIFDEIHKFKSSKAMRTKKALKVFKNTPYKLGLSGTTITKHWDIYSQINVLDPTFWKQHGIHSYRQFLTRFFVCHPQFYYPLYMPKGNIKIMMDLVSPIILTKKRDETNIPEVQYIVEEFDMKMPNLKEIMDLGDFQKTLVEASGFNRQKELVNNAKLQFLLDKLEESGQKSIIFCRFLHEVEYIKNVIGDCYVITGQNKKDLNEAVDKGDKTVVSTYCLKEGADGLQNNFSQMFFFSIPLPHRDFVQSIGRVHRPGQKNKVVVYVMLGGWIDKHIFEILQNGEDALSHFMSRFRLKKEITEEV